MVKSSNFSLLLIEIHYFQIVGLSAKVTGNVLLTTLFKIAVRVTNKNTRKPDDYQLLLIFILKQYRLFLG